MMSHGSARNSVRPVVRQNNAKDNNGAVAWKDGAGRDGKSVVMGKSSGAGVVDDMSEGSVIIINRLPHDDAKPKKSTQGEHMSSHEEDVLAGMEPGARNVAGAANSNTIVHTDNSELEVESMGHMDLRLVHDINLDTQTGGMELCGDVDLAGMDEVLVEVDSRLQDIPWDLYPLEVQM